MEVNNLFENAMKGQWAKVVEAYEKNPIIREAKITRSEDTALHIAASDDQTDVVLKLLQCIDKNAFKILSIKNERGNTPLHLAAALGNVVICHCMASKDPKLITLLNTENETPLFLAALHGQKKAFLCLHYFRRKIDYSICRKSNGDTILHSAISREYFSLAFQITRLYPDLVNSVNENGLSPLHIIASKPNSFQSSSRLGLFDRIIYRCIFVDELNEETYDHEACTQHSAVQRSHSYPENYKTCMNFFRLIRALFEVLTKPRKNKIGYQLSHCLKLKNKHGNTGDEENPPKKSIIAQGEGTTGASSSANKSELKDARKEVSDAKSSGSDSNYYYPPNYAIVVQFFKLMVKALFIILGFGIERINKITEKKERHTWAFQVMNDLVQHASMYKYDDNGRNPQNSQPVNDEETLEVPEVPPTLDNNEISQSSDTNVGMNYLTESQNKDQNGPEKKDKPILVAAKMGVTEMVDRLLNTYPTAIQELNTSQKNLVLLTFEKKETLKPGEKETPILIAAKMGVVEVVEKILDTFPVAVRDLDSDKKNIVLLAVENRQTHVYKLLLNRKILKESVFRQVDNQGNSALHLAAMYGEYRPWLIPGAALQMQWEIKWYKVMQFVKYSMAPHFFVRYNKKGQTPSEIFTDTHKDLVQSGSKWLTKTSESCSVVAALIATVAFSTSSTVPGGVNQNSGAPILEDKAGFDVFAISSLLALCFSVTALVFFLSILTSRYQEQDFAKDLPRKLLLGLTSLFTSIAAMLISFCSGHFFVLTKKLRSAAFPIYAVTFLPVTFFAFAQLPLYFDLTWAIFKKVPQRSYKVFPH